jgi:hypothetical protein
MGCGWLNPSVVVFFVSSTDKSRRRRPTSSEPKRQLVGTCLAMSDGREGGAQRCGWVAGRSSMREEDELGCPREHECGHVGEGKGECEGEGRAITESARGCVAKIPHAKPQ